MKLLNESQIAEFLRRFAVQQYDPVKFRYRVRRFWDTQDIALAASASAVTSFFASSAAPISSRSHTRGLAGCNLNEPGRLPGNSSFVVAQIEAYPLVCTTAAKINDAQLFAEYGYMKGLYVRDDPVLDEIPVSALLSRRGTEPINTTDGGGAVGLAIQGVRGAGDGEGFTPESYAVIPDGSNFRLDIGFNGPANLSAALMVRVEMLGLSIARR